MAPSSAGTATLLFSDIEGSTRRWADSPSMAEALAEHDAVLRSVITTAGGRWVKHTGDGVFAVFARASHAVSAAVAIQRAIRKTFDQDPMLVRVGLHTGEVEHRDDDVFGLAVSTAARIMNACHGGQVVISGATKAVLGPSTGAEFGLVDLGAHRLKDLGEPQPLFQVTASGLESQFPPLRTLEAVDHNFPVQLTTFIGREEALEEIVDLVGQHRLVTLTGVGGAGKTRLSLQAASELVERFQEGARFVELAAVSNPDAVPVAVSSALGVRHEPGSPGGVVDRLLDHLRGREMLLVIDNCEHVLGAAASVIGQIMSAAPDVTVIASSREGLGIRGERIWQVPSLVVTGDGEQSEATRLFMDRATAVASQLEWNDETRPHIVRICELLDGIPLAIELAAARTRVLAPEQIAARLSDRFRLLTGGARSALPRQQTLEAAVDWSYQLLSDAERQLFERLSVFVGGFALEAVEAVCAGGEVEEGDVLDLLTGLVDKSMITTDRGTAGVERYRTLETLRQYGLRRLGDRDEIEHWKQRHLSFYAEQVEGIDVLGWDMSANLAWCATEQGNLDAALEWARTEPAPAVPALAAALSVHSLLTAGDPEEALALADLAIGAADQADGLALRLGGTRMRILQSLGRLEESQASWTELEARLDGADDEDAAWCLARAAVMYAFDPELDAGRAIPLAREAVRRTEGAGPQARFWTTMALSQALVWSNQDSAEAVRIVQSAIDLARALGEVDGLMYALSTLIMVTMSLDQREGTDLTSDVEDDLLSVWEQSGRATRDQWVVWTAIRRGMWDLAEEELRRQDVELRGRHRVQMLMPRACLRWMQGRLEEADDDFDAVEALDPIRRWHHDYYPSRAEVAAIRGDRAGTEEWVRRHFAVAMDSVEEVMRIAGLRALTMAHVDAGDVDAAHSVLGRMKSISGRHPVVRAPSIQVGSRDFYIAAAEAEVTRSTGSDPEAWARAERLASWVYWRLYCQVRRVEAGVARGDFVAAEIDAVRAELEELHADGLAALLDSSVPPGD
jgi:predicted ATPase/class 3 adenylate cyclase